MIIKLLIFLYGLELIGLIALYVHWKVRKDV